MRMKILKGKMTDMEFNTYGDAEKRGLESRETNWISLSLSLSLLGVPESFGLGVSWRVFVYMYIRYILTLR